MLFLSVQPDKFFFTWQLELQIYNFNKIGISPKDIHVLLGFNPKRKLDIHFQQLIQRNKGKACFFPYPDLRESKYYPASLRAYIIKQHLLVNSHLEKESIFYHDADIVFRELPDFESLLKNDTWYFSDTRSYLDSSYIKMMAGEEMLSDMCKVVGIDVQTVIDNDSNCGGAQYLLKGATYTYWDKVERDSEALYALMQEHNSKVSELVYIKTGDKTSYLGIQAWCADMWAVFWNALYFGNKVRLHPELAFSLAKSSMAEWEKNKILHYSGDSINVKGPIFWRANYKEVEPFYDINLDKINPDSAGFALVNIIKEYKKELDKNRVDLKDVTFLIPVRIDSESRLENLYAITKYLSKYINTNIIIAEADVDAKIDTAKLPKDCLCTFIKDNNHQFHKTHINNLLIEKAKTDIIALWEADIVLPISQIAEGINEIRLGKSEMVYPYDGRFVAVTNLFKAMFVNILDPELLTLNSGKFILHSRRSYGGAVFLNKSAYIEAGMENESFTSWGPDDRERKKRMQTFGYKIKHIEGTLFHLPHDRRGNSRYANKKLYIKFMKEYFNISNMNEDDLNNYVASWSWVNKLQIAQ